MNTKTNGEADEDSLFLEHVLDKLYDFGNGPSSKQKPKSQKRKKRQRSDEEDETEASSPSTEEAYRETEGTATVSDHVDPGQRAPAIQQVSQVEVVTFQDPRKKMKTKASPAPVKVSDVPTTRTKQEKKLEKIDLEKARLEVHRFGITGYKKEQQRVFEEDRAIMLGARPPKKEYVNYKALQQQIKEKKQKAKEDTQPELKKKKKTSNPRDKKKPLSTSSASGKAPTGQVGRFKNGLLILSSKEIQKIKSSKFGK